MDKFNIDMPDDFEIRNQINTIVNKGLPSKKSFYLYIKDMYKKIGLRNLFHDLSELIFIGLLVSAILLFGIIRLKSGLDIGKEEIYTFVFIISPLFYLVTSVFSFINIKENNTYETEMVCKYNLHQVSALRMLVFSVISILVNIAFVVALYSKIELLRGIMISITSIFLFSSILLYSIVRYRGNIGKYFVICGWILLNGVLIKSNNSQYMNILENMPLVVYFFVSVVCAYVYISNIKMLSRYNKIEII